VTSFESEDVFNVYELLVNGELEYPKLEVPFVPFAMSIQPEFVELP